MWTQGQRIEMYAFSNENPLMWTGPKKGAKSLRGDFHIFKVLKYLKYVAFNGRNLCETCATRRA